MIKLATIRTDRTQTRDGIRPQAVQEYAEHIKAGEKMDPAVGFDDGHDIWLGAGFHRAAAYEMAGKLEMPVELRKGTRWDAIEFGICDNQQHRGERLTAADKRHNVELILREKSLMSDSAIGQLCAVSHTTVAKYRRELEATCQICKSPSSRIGKDGRVCDTEAIGRKTSPEGSGQAIPHGAKQVEADSPQEPSQAVVSLDKCPCGGEWSSDGEGGRFCSACNGGYPASQPGTTGAVEVVEAAPVPAVDTKPSQPPDLEAQASALFKQAYRNLGTLKATVDGLGGVKPGPHYALASNLLDKVDSQLMKWQELGDVEPIEDDNFPDTDGAEEFNP
jgi:hypothetical protein